MILLYKFWYRNTRMDWSFVHTRVSSPASNHYGISSRWWTRLWAETRRTLPSSSWWHTRDFHVPRCVTLSWTSTRINLFSSSSLPCHCHSIPLLHIWVLDCVSIALAFRIPFARYSILFNIVVSPCQNSCRILFGSNVWCLNIRPCGTKTAQTARFLNAFNHLPGI